MSKESRPGVEAVCTELRRKYPLWSDKKILAEAKVIHKKRSQGQK